MNESVDRQSSPTLVKLISGIDHTSNVKNMNVPLKRVAWTLRIGLDWIGLD